MIKNILKIFILSLIFSVVIYFINYYFFGSIKEIENNIAEEKYIEKENEKIQKKIKFNKKILSNKQKNTLKNYYKNIENKIKYIFLYTPINYKSEISFFQENLTKILNNNIFNSKISQIEINLIKEKLDRRGKMKNKKIILFGITKNTNNEYLSVFTHEFGHYIDLYFLEKKVFFDISSKFYQISWNSTKIKKQNQNIGDFVSGYSMTNKYEDFAETFTYYILHNKDFLKKTKKSKILKQKYNFFSDFLFKNKEFFATNFTQKNHKIKNYYRDITKIEFDKEKLFNYLEKYGK